MPKDIYRASGLYEVVLGEVSMVNVKCFQGDAYTGCFYQPQV